MSVYLAIITQTNVKEHDRLRIEVFESENEERAVSHILRDKGYYNYENNIDPTIVKIEVYKLESASYKVFSDLDKKYIAAFNKYQLDKIENEERALLVKLKEKYESKENENNNKQEV